MKKQEDWSTKQIVSDVPSLVTKPRVLHPNIHEQEPDIHYPREESIGDVWSDLSRTAREKRRAV